LCFRQGNGMEYKERHVYLRSIPYMSKRGGECWYSRKSRVAYSSSWGKYRS
jgi:hypothetical protein